VWIGIATWTVWFLGRLPHPFQPKAKQGAVAMTNQTEAFLNRIAHPITAENDAGPSDYQPTLIATPVTFCGELATTDGLQDLTSAEIAPEVQTAIKAVYGIDKP
jgi:hypothetical protein